MRNLVNGEMLESNGQVALDGPLLFEREIEADLLEQAPAKARVPDLDWTIRK